MELAGGIIIKDNKILLIHRNTARSVQWEVPGGKIEIGESPRETAIREIKEELGVSVKSLSPFLTIDFIEDGLTHTYHIFFVCCEITKISIKEPQCFDKYSFFSIEELNSMQNLLSPTASKLLIHLNNERYIPYMQ